MRGMTEDRPADEYGRRRAKGTVLGMEKCTADRPTDPRLRLRL